MHELRRISGTLGIISLVAVLALTGCDITPRYPVLEGNGGRSSLTPTDEAYAEGADATPPRSTNIAPDDHSQERTHASPGNLQGQVQDIPRGTSDATPAVVRRNNDDE